MKWKKKTRTFKFNLHGFHNRMPIVLQWSVTPVITYKVKKKLILFHLSQGKKIDSTLQR